MPAAGVVVAAVATTAGAYFAGTSLTTALILGGIQLGLGVVSQVMAPKLQKPNTDFGISGARTQNVRQPITSRKLVYGKVRVGGPLAYIGTTSNDKFLHYIVLLATHEVQEIGTVYLNDTPIYADQLNGSGLVTSGPYANLVRIKRHLGADNQTADADAVAEITGWTNDHRLRGIAYLYLRFEANPDAFPTGAPNISAEVKGKKVLDTRTSNTVFTTNPALIIRDWLTDTRYGMRVTGTISNVNATANICDEMVATKALAATAASVSAANDTITLNNINESVLCPFNDGDRIQVTSTGSIPSGLSVGTNYFVIVTKERDTPQIKLATSYANAMAGTAINITGAGSGTITITKNAEPRYTAAGIIDTASADYDILTQLVFAMAGRLFSPTAAGGQWWMVAGAWQSSSFTFEPKHLTGPISVQTRIPRADRFTAVSGVYASPQTYGEPTNYPPVTSAAYDGEDGEQVFATLDLPYTYRSQTAQRISRIHLNRLRRQITVNISTSLHGLQVMAGDTVAITNERYGWNAKTFEVVRQTIGAQPDGDGVPLLGVSMTLRELDANVFDFNETVDEVLINPAPRSTLPNPFAMEPPTNLTVTSGTSALYLKSDGTVVSRIYAQWVASPSGFTDRYEVQSKRSADSDWEPSFFVTPDLTSTYIWDVEDGDAYDIRVRAVNTIGVRSAWATNTGHVVVGKTTPPSNVTGFSAQQNGNVVNFKWSQIPDVDLAGYEIRYRAQTSITPFPWDSAIPLTRTTRGTLVTNGAVPPGNWTAAIRAVDTSGNLSTLSTTYDIVVKNENDVIYNKPEGPQWLGTKTNLIKHDVSQSLVITTTDANSLGNDYNVFDNFYYNPQTEGTYEAPEIDLGFDDTGVRIYADIAASLGPDETTGTPDAELLIDYRTSSGSYDGFEVWGLGFVDARYIKQKVRMKSSEGQMFLQQFIPVADQVERTETGSTTVGIGGTAITFTKRFFFIPNIQATASGTSALIVMKSSEAETGFTAQVFNTSGVDVGGVIDWQATGV